MADFFNYKETLKDKAVLSVWKNHKLFKISRVKFIISPGGIVPYLTDSIISILLFNLSLNRFIESQ